MLTAPSDFGLTRAALVFSWVVEDARLLLRNNDEDQATRVGLIVCAHVADWWPRFPACSEFLEGANWQRYLYALTVPVVQQMVNGERSYGEPEERVIADFMDCMAAELLDDDGAPLLSMEEQQAAHLRYRLGTAVMPVAHTMALSASRARDLLYEALTKLEEGIRRWRDEHPDPDA